jgi:hypothetical protein
VRGAIGGQRSAVNSWQSKKNVKIENMILKNSPDRSGKPGVAREEPARFWRWVARRKTLEVFFAHCDEDLERPEVSGSRT